MLGVVVELRLGREGELLVWMDGMGDEAETCLSVPISSEMANTQQQ